MDSRPGSGLVGEFQKDAMRYRRALKDRGDFRAVRPSNTYVDEPPKVRGARSEQCTERGEHRHILPRADPPTLNRKSVELRTHFGQYFNAAARASGRNHVPSSLKQVSNNPRSSSRDTVGGIC